MNKNEYKNAFSGVQPSNEAVERIMDMNTKNKLNFNSVFKRTASAFMALAILIGGGFGVNYAVNKSNSNNELGVLVAYASNGSFTTVDKLDEQDVFYGIYVIPEDDEELRKSTLERYNRDDTELINYRDELNKKGYGSSGGHGSNGLYDDTGKFVGMLKTIEGSSIALDLDDYSEVKTFTVNNESKYGQLQFEYASEKAAEFLEEYPYMCDENYVVSDEELEELYAKYPELILQNHEFKLSGDELRYSYNTRYGEMGLGRHKVCKGYWLTWEISDELVSAISENPDFDLSQIKDTITFTVEFNDGTVKTASIDLYFDSDGYMHFEK